jgi:hypothetical protein
MVRLQRGDAAQFGKPLNPIECGVQIQEEDGTLNPLPSPGTLCRMESIEKKGKGLFSPSHRLHTEKSLPSANLNAPMKISPSRFLKDGSTWKG